MSTPASNRLWRPHGAARPLKAWRRAELDAFTHILEQAWVAWTDAWGMRAQSAGETGGAPATPADVSAVSWKCLGTRNGGAAWMAWPAGFDREVARRVFDADDASTPVVRAVLSACGADLRIRLAAALRVEQGIAPGPTAADGAAWSGSVLVRLGELQVFATAAVLEPWSERKPPHTGSESMTAGAPVVPITRALAHREIDLEVTLAGCEIDWGTLQALRPGDVLPTEHALAMPAQVCTRSGERVFSAHLVRRRALRAIQLAATDCTNTGEGGP